MRFFGLSTCDTCRKALKALRGKGLSPEVIDVRDDGLTDEEWAAILAAFGDKAINRASTTWRNLTEHERATEPAELLARYPALMKRPVIEHNGDWFQGWSKAVQDTLLS